MNRRLYVLIGGFLALLVLIAALAVPVSSAAPALSVRSAEADGSMALDQWLAASGYRVQEVTSLAEQLDSVNLLFVLNPILDTSAADAALMRAWVRRGNTLIVAGDPLYSNDLLDPFGVQLTFLAAGDLRLSPAAPTLVDPPFGAAQVEAVYGISSERDDAVPHLFSEGQPVLASFAEGAGRLWVAGALRPFTNLGLNDPGNARLIANLVSGVPHQAVIGFDEAAHGFGVNNQPTLSGWLFGTARGWGILIGFVVTMVYLGLRGRRFGRALPLPDQHPRRDSGEYIQAIATLLRRSGQRGEIVQHYEQQLRRRLSERYAVDPKLGAAQLARATAQREPALDAAALEALLTQLARRNVSEHELVTTAAEVDRWLRSMA